MITLVLVDDLAATRQGLRMLLALEPDMTVVGEAANGEEALVLIETARPDVVVMDTAMPGLDGIAATRLLRERGASAAVIVHSIHDDPVMQASAAAAGAVAFVGKHDGYPALLAAIRSAKPSSAPDGE